jgi:hypothetical protein
MAVICVVTTVAVVKQSMFLKIDHCSIDHDAKIKKISTWIEFIHTLFEKKNIYMYSSDIDWGQCELLLMTSFFSGG